MTASNVVKLPVTVTPIASFRATFGAVRHDYDFANEQEKSHMTHLQRVILAEFFIDPACLRLYLKDYFHYTLKEAQEILLAYDIGEVVFTLAAKMACDRLQYIDYLKNEQS